MKIKPPEIDGIITEEEFKHDVINALFGDKKLQRQPDAVEKPASKKDIQSKHEKKEKSRVH